MTDAYAAGLIDGEGCITLSHDKRGNFYSARVDVGMAKRAKATLEAMAVEYGGTVRRFRDATEEWEEAFTWTVTSRKAVLFVQRIYPHLQIKQEQARLILAFQNMVDALPKQKNGNPSWNSETREKASAIRVLIQESNRKGPQKEPESGWFARVVGDYCLTSQADMFSELGFTQYSESFPDSGFMQNGYLYELQISAPRTSASGCLSWPIPTACNPDSDRSVVITDSGRVEISGKISGIRGTGCLSDAARVWQTPATDSFRSRGRDRKDEMGLDQQARFFPTPSARDWKSGDASQATMNRNSRPLNEVAEHLNWPTPRHTTSGMEVPEKQIQRVLSGQENERGAGACNLELSACLHLLPAPATQDGQSSSQSAPGSRRRLNPRFVEWLMGFPISWSEL